MCVAMLAPLATQLGATTIGAELAGMTAMQSISTGMSIFGTGLSALSSYNQASAQKQVARNNAATAELQAQDAQRRGEQDAMEVQRKAAAVRGAQRVGLAAHGLDLTYGTAQDLQDQTDFFGQADANTVRHNASKEAWSRRAQGANYSAEANATKPWLAGGSTLLAGAGQVADKWYSYGRKAAPAPTQSRLTAGLVL